MFFVYIIIKCVVVYIIKNVCCCLYYFKKCVVVYVIKTFVVVYII